MKKDQLPSRRMLLTGAAALGAAGAAGWAGLLLDDDPVRPAHGALGVAGPGARTRQKASVFRLRPMTGYGPARPAPVRTAVRRAPILSLPGRGRSMVLTFDDGPDPRYTPGILRTLREYDVRAMFLVCGEMAADHKDLLREMADDGHIVGNHTWSHPLLTLLTRAEIRSETERTCGIVKDAYGRAPLWFRAPYGAWNRAAFELGAELGMEPPAWTVDSGDWTTPPPDAKAIVEQVEAGAAPGVVVLSHDAGGDRSQTVAALRVWLPSLLDAGYRLTVPRRRSN